MLKINGRGRGFLRVDADGATQPFFWLGDTAWLLFHRLKMDEIELYLKNRALKGFTVIQATLAHENGAHNPYGSPALINGDFAAPNADFSPTSYWGQVDGAIRYAGSLGIAMALLPAWGGFTKGGQLNESNAVAYTGFLAKHFGKYENVIWLLGGDVRGDVAPDTFALLGNELHKKCPNQLVGYHPFGRCISTMWFAGCDWLDFNMFQSGHRDYNQIKLNEWDDAVDRETWVGEDNYRYVESALSRDPRKPVLDGEPSYELIPHGLHDPSQPYWEAADVRRYAYWSLLAGAAGHTYGHNAIMQFWNGDGTPAYGALAPWQTALHDVGAMQMGHARLLMEAVDWQTGAGAQELLPHNDGIRYEYNLAFLTDVAACVYTYTGKPFTVDMDKLPFTATAYWFDPVVGGVSIIGDAPGTGEATFTPPDRRLGPNDWVLILADRARIGQIESRLNILQKERKQ